jgi:hypothetical protein
MNASAFEAFLTRVYVDAAARARFKANPRGEALRAGLSHEECTTLENTDWVGLELVARSFARKRQMKRKPRSHFSFTNFFVSFARRMRGSFSPRLGRNRHPPSTE